MVKRASHLAILALIAVATLGACGQRGPLYLPKPVARPAQPSPTQAEPAKTPATPGEANIPKSSR